MKPRPRLSLPITEIEAAYIKANCHNTPVIKMAKHLGRTATTIYAYMDQHNLKVYRSRETGYVRAVKVKTGEFFENGKNWIV